MAASKNIEQQQLSEGLANSCKKIVSLILLQNLINDFTVCKQGSGGTLLPVEDVASGHGVQGRIQNKYVSSESFNVKKCRPP